MKTHTAAQPYGVAPPAHQLPNGTHIRMVRLQVSDLPRSVAYYEEIIGLRAYSTTSDAATLGPHDEQRPLVNLHTRSGVVPARRGAFGLYHFAILLPDRAALGRFVTHVSGAGVHVGMADHFVSEAIYLWDPDGLGIEIYADRPRRTWQQRDRELVMTTEPLDVTSLIAAGGEQPWDGMPQGTTIGHVHFHVGSLNDAEAYYHAALGFDKMVWSYPGALFLAAGGYHHHLGTNVWAPGPSAKEHEARLLEWELVVPDDTDVDRAARSLSESGHITLHDASGFITADPWGTRLRIAPVERAAR